MADPTLFACWFGAPMSERRKESLKSLSSSGLSVTLVTTETFPEYGVPDVPIHEAFPYLSATHQADYARTYLMHFHGGGYSDIKPTSASWQRAVEDFADPNVWIVGYQEVGPNGVANVPDRELQKTLRASWSDLVGNGAYLVRPGTPLTQSWFEGLHALMNEKEGLLRTSPAQHPRSVAGDGSGYPLRWAEILGEIFHPLVYRHRAHVRQGLPPPSFHDYQ